MYQLSDSDSKDSDEGIRFKTDSIRYKSDRKRRSRSRSRNRDSSHRKKSKKLKKHHKKTRRSSSSSSDGSKSYKHSRRFEERTTKTTEDHNESKNKDNLHDDPENYGPQLPTTKIEDKQTIEPELVTQQESTDTFGPALPTHLQNKIQSEPNIVPQNEEESHCIGPQLPQDLLNKNDTETSCIGPQLPPHLCKKSDQNEDDSNVEQELDLQKEYTANFGPELPPHLQNKIQSQIKEERSCIGPQLPPHLRDKLHQQDQDDDDDDDEEIYGPLPVDSQLTTAAQIALEERALKLKMDQLEPCQNQITTREEWMLELPDVKAVHLGLGPRQFRKKDKPDLTDRSSWTDTPNMKKPQKPEIDLRKQAELIEIQRRDEEQEEMSKKHKKKDKQSLVEMHQDKLNKMKQESGSSTERRPFNRETDLQVNRFDEAQKKAVLKKAQLLDDRFARGQSKFL